MKEQGETREQKESLSSRANWKKPQVTRFSAGLAESGDVSRADGPGHS